ncbi:amidohydrolase family protein [Seohaeicola zhoushanensis]|uniref:4-hydroxyphenyl-beta-ketoacyl-CoA hydrolase n=1 Tax=Seohaeicola zhoushanensis TaxID=1569283 RepID=A0A8J3GU43_9RHOB|nr:amidohydrolase family protein [Seohaeicola zhoushanensis]GHF34011.1 4-hydroxyphenyl-beta-ketoacyl-CoA hydrolase [Seohaeicola zhoushanensis]
MIDFDKIVAIDIHTHAEEPCCGHRDDGYDEFQAGMAKYFKNPAGAQGMLPSVQETAAYYRERNIAAVIFPVDAERETGFRRYSNEEVAQICAENDDILIPFASVDPWKGKAGIREIRRLVRDFGVQGFKFHPTMQGFWPNEHQFFPIYDAIQEEGKIALFHTGQTGVGSGMRGGMGMKLKYSNPMALDDVAAEFPDLKIILAHPSFPWQEEALAVCQHKPNVYIDLSGWSPKYFPEILVKYANSLLKKKMLFGSDWPAITPDRWLADFEQAGFRDEVKQLILKDNARRLLGV